MSHNHHTHTHSLPDASGKNKKVLFVSLLIIGVYMVVELVGGVLTHSLALLSDAGHMFSDALALLLSLIAFHLSTQPFSQQRTYGYQRFEVIAAAINGLALVGIAVLIIYEAVDRLMAPPKIATTGMLVISILGLLVNVVVARYMHQHSETEHNINMRGAYLHVLGDLLGSVGAIIAALLMMIFGWWWADPVVSIIVALLIAFSAYGILKTTLQVLMEGVPAVVTLDDLNQVMLSVPEVKAVHDLHVWTITSGWNALSCHIVVEGTLTVSQAEQLVLLLEQKLLNHEIHHVTIQVETDQHHHAEALLCHLQHRYDEGHHH
ncbi:cation diffusion facilitator family transporter [Neisseriaceae bacterium ESL0693]|nr:cation diffusion facilitator family transporter [Neisseriaceae bacterium ESL0693]